jgi:hypothetical protein
MSNRSKKVLKSIEKWAAERASETWSNHLFTVTGTCFLTPDQQERLARFAHEIFKAKDLLPHIGPWEFFDSHGEELVNELRRAYNRANIETPAKSSSQPQQSVVSASNSGSWHEIETPISLSQRVLPTLPPTASTAPADNKKRCALMEISGNTARRPRSEAKR